MAQGDLTKLEGRLHTAVTPPRRRSRPGRYGRTEWPWHYLWRAVDQDGHVLDILVQSRRSAKAAKRFFRKMLKQVRSVAFPISDVALSKRRSCRDRATRFRGRSP